MAAADGACFICHESHPQPIQCGCACRDDAGLAHVDCLEQAAVTEARAEAWCMCRTCNQSYTGAMLTGLAKAWWSRARDQPEESPEGLTAAYVLAYSFKGDGTPRRRRPSANEVHATQMRMLGRKHPDTLSTASHLACTLFRLREYANAKQLLEATLKTQLKTREIQLAMEPARALTWAATAMVRCHRAADGRG